MEKEIEVTIRMKNLALSATEWETINKFIAHNNTVTVDTLFMDESEVTPDLFHSTETNKRIMKNRASDLAIRLLRSGIKIIFLDGLESENHIRKMSPPLYNKYYSSQIKQ